MASAGIVLVKKFTYRGALEEWSNRYHFSDTAPTTPAAWKTLVDALAAQEKTIYQADIRIIRAYCYTDTSQDAASTIDYTALGAEIPGTFSSGGVPPDPGDCAMWIRWATSATNSRGKPIYLRKYYHGVVNSANTVGNDAVNGPQKAALLALGNKLRDGTLTDFTLCGPSGAAAGVVAVSQWSTTRTLKRRGKRPPTP